MNQSRQTRTHARYEVLGHPRIQAVDRESLEAGFVEPGLTADDFHFQ